MHNLSTRWWPSMLKRRRVTAVVAHPDDEVLGCGGALRRHVLDGDEVSILILADGETSRDNVASAAMSRRKEAAQNAAAILGAHQVVLNDFRDNQLDTVPL